MIPIRSEEPDDIPEVRAVNKAAFPTSAEADLVDTLRNRNAHVLSLVAVQDMEVIGHILFSPVRIETETGDFAALGLAPMAVSPGHQRSGIGSALVEAGLSRCTKDGHAAVVVLGHPDYYPRFGFRPSTEYGIVCEFPSPPEAFMVLELQPGVLDGISGLAKYHAAFDEL